MKLKLDATNCRCGAQGTADYFGRVRCEKCRGEDLLRGTANARAKLAAALEARGNTRAAATERRAVGILNAKLATPGN